MKRTFLLLFFVCLVFGCNAQNLDSMYTCLDKAIANSSEYMRNKQFRIDELKNQYRYANNGIGKYNIGLKLYEEYHALMNDSAISYLNRCIQISEDLHREDLKVRAYILIAHQFAVAGFYAEAQYYYSLIDKNKIKGSNIVDYYYGLCHLYGDMAFYAKDNKMKQLYFKTSDNYLSQLP